MTVYTVSNPGKSQRVQDLLTYGRTDVGEEAERVAKLATPNGNLNNGKFVISKSVSGHELLDKVAGGYHANSRD